MSAFDPMRIIATSCPWGFPARVALSRAERQTSRYDRLALPRRRMRVGCLYLLAQLSPQELRER